jgi:glycosyltransferase involved in cell wall biosynthesis
VRILHVIPSVHRGGAQVMLLRLLENARDNHHGVISLMPLGGLRAPMAAAGATLHSLGLPQGRMSARSGIGLARAIRSFQPDLVQGWMYHGNLAATIGCALGRRAGPVLWGVHHSITTLAHEKPSTRRIIRLSAWLSRGTAKVVYVSRASASQHEQLGFEARRTIVIPNGFDCTVFRPQPAARMALRRALGLDERPVLIGMVARYHPLKDHTNLFAAAARLASGSAIHLVLVGAGVDAGNRDLQEAIRAAGLAERVTLLGERRDIPDLMAGLDILALTSRDEAFPMVLGEAMASGVPCVATDVGDSRLIVGDTGVLVPPNDPDALAAGLKELIQQDMAGRARLGEAARRRIEEAFSAPAIAGRYLDLYKRVVEGAPC